MAKATTDKIRAASAESKKSPARLQQSKLPFESLSKPSQSQKSKVVDDVPQARGGGWTITRTNAREEYHLTNDDLKGLQSETKPTLPKNGEDSRTMVLYHEQDVERRAWERHGGKRQFINHLKMLSKKHNARKNSGGEQSFKVPHAYRGDVLGQSGATPGPSQANQTTPARNLSIPLSPTLAQIKNTMMPWFWNEFTEELERWESCQKRRGHKGLGIRRWETAMRRAAVFAETYPARPPPSHVPTKSPWMSTLRTTLAEAPRMPRNYTRGFVEGIVPFGRTPIGTSLIALDDWDDAYHLRVFAAVAAVVKAHGLEEAGWASARWEVYDTYVDCVGCAIVYSPHREEWFDPGARWLEDEYRLRGPSRDYLQTEAGRERVFPKIPSPTYRSAAGGSSSM
ncbi:hypothetical protein VTO73DRAFT_5142 [Trametes versicolor]